MRQYSDRLAVLKLKEDEKKAIAQAKEGNVDVLDAKALAKQVTARALPAHMCYQKFRAVARQIKSHCTAKTFSEKLILSEFYDEISQDAARSFVSSEGAVQAA